MNSDRFFSWIIIICITILMLIAFNSCSKTTYIPVETIKRDSIYITSHQVDTLLKTDSVFTLVKGDTVITDRWHTIYKVQLKVDTVSVDKVDSVQVPYPVVNEVVKYKTPILTKVFAWIGGFFLICFLILLLIVFKNKVY